MLSTVQLNESAWYARAVPAAPLPRTDRRAEIVRVAYRLIAERGLEGLRFADVASAAGINNGTLLYYFASKNALIEAVGAYLVEQFSQSAAPRDGDAPTDALAQLRWEFADAQERLSDQLGLVYTELLVRAQRDPAVAALLRDIDSGWRGWLISLLERGQRSGIFRADLDRELVATTIMATIRGVGMQALVAGDAHAVAPVMQAVEELVEAWVVGSPSGGTAV
jgi:AcrR family transcriptional regulator